MNPKYQYQESTARTCEWVTRNLAHNLDFVPDDKLNWKPVPEANSALEIMAHLLDLFAGIRSLLEGGDGQAKVVAPTNRDEAKQSILSQGNEFAAVLRALSDDRLEEIVATPYGPLPISFLMSLPVTDAVHHHGQIAYLQSLLGDTQPHFDIEAFKARI